MSTAGPPVVNSWTAPSPGSSTGPVDRSFDAPSTRVQPCVRDGTPGTNRPSLCKGKAEREPAATGGLVSHEEGKRGAGDEPEER